MRRRDFIKVVAGSTITWPLAARAQQLAMPVIGLMGADTATAQSQWTAAFVHRLHELGWTEGRNVGIEYRWAEGRSERFGQFAAEFVRLKVAVILTHNTPLGRGKAGNVSYPDRVCDGSRPGWHRFGRQFGAAEW